MKYILLPIAWIIIMIVTIIIYLLLAIVKFIWNFKLLSFSDFIGNLFYYRIPKRDENHVTLNKIYVPVKNPIQLIKCCIHSTTDGELIKITNQKIKEWEITKNNNECITYHTNKYL